MQFVGLSALLLLFATSYGQDTQLSTDIIANVWTTVAFIDIPRFCNYTNKQASLEVYNTSQAAPIFSNNFIIPQCRLKRELVVINNSASGNVETVNVGYKVTGLTPGTKYTARYVIDGQAFNNLSFTTLTVGTPAETFARSGGMVVITVLLSIAMFLLIVGLIVVIALGGRGK